MVNTGIIIVEYKDRHRYPIQMSDSIMIDGTVFISEGILSDVTGESYKFIKKRQIIAKNQVAYTGLSYVLKYGWGVSAAIAIGTGTDATSPHSIKLSNELSNSLSGRFPIRGTAETREKNGIVYLTALWVNTQGYTDPVEEWGIFVTAPGQPIGAKDSGKLFSRLLQNFSRTPGMDVEITWVVDFTA